MLFSTSFLFALFCALVCQNKTYGADCSEECGHCLGGQQCNHVIGTCHIGCDAGYYNYLCKGGILTWKKKLPYAHQSILKKDLMYTGK